MLALPDYAELHCVSNFSFLRGASHAEELVARAQELGYTALAITDECSFAGLVRAHGAAKAVGMRLICGSEITLADGMKLVLLAQNRAGYGNLSAIVSLGRRHAEKGCYHLTRGDLLPGIPDCLALWVAPAGASPDDARWLAGAFPARAWIAFERHLAPDDAERLAALRALSEASGLPLVAAGDVHMHVRGRRALQDVLVALRLKTSVDAAGHALGTLCLMDTAPRAFDEREKRLLQAMANDLMAGWRDAQAAGGPALPAGQAAPSATVGQVVPQ